METESETEEEVTDSEDGGGVIKVFSDDAFSDESIERYLYIFIWRLEKLSPF